MNVLWSTDKGLDGTGDSNETFKEDPESDYKEKGSVSRGDWTSEVSLKVVEFDSQ